MIGKTRHQSGPGEARIEESFDPALPPPRGVLRLKTPAAGVFRHARRSVSPALAPWIDHYWMVYWDLRGLEPHAVATLPHPNVHLVFEAEGSKAWGVSTSKFSRLLEGASLTPSESSSPRGGFFPFLRAPVSTLANRSVPVEDIFGPEVAELETALLSTGDEDAMMRAADSFLLERLPKADAKVEQARQLVDLVLRDQDILTVDDLATRAGISIRSLQRLFSQYVGASPKWVIRRYRLHELLERLHSGEHLHFATLAAELGYFDQAHLIRDFKSIVGYTPGEYPGLQQP